VTKDPRVYLAQILERIERIERYAAGGRDAFLAAPLVQDAVIRNFEVIGEAAKRIPVEYQAEHPQVPWRSLAAFRDVLIHQYEGVDLLQVWQVVERDLSPLKSAIVAILPPLDQLERELAGDPGVGDRN
jgi:uncharacterized protein with HEPN domain